jgi:hypothetical protein
MIVKPHNSNHRTTLGKFQCRVRNEGLETSSNDPPTDWALFTELPKIVLLWLNADHKFDYSNVKTHEAQ